MNLQDKTPRQNSKIVDPSFYQDSITNIPAIGFTIDLRWGFESLRNTQFTCIMSTKQDLHKTQWTIMIYDLTRQWDDIKED